MTVIDRTQCPDCLDSSEDNLVHYEDGSTYCYACNEVKTKGRGVTKPKPLTNLISGTFQDLGARGISSQTCEFMGYQLGKFFGEPCHIANYFDEFGTLVAQKIRRANKQFTVVGDSEKLDLFGKHLYTPNEKMFITITEGELDALSLVEARGNQWPVVSLPNGAASAVKTIKNNLEWLEKFKYVVLGFDNDEVGREAAQKCSELFSPGKVKVALWPAKDPNDLLTQGRYDDIKRAILSAKEVRPDSIVSVEDIIDDALVKPSMGLSWPWESLTSLTYGINMNEIYAIGAGSGIGKTEFFKDIILHLTFHHKQKVGVISFEQKPTTTLLRLAGGVCNKRLHVPTEEWTDEEAKDAMTELKGYVYFYDHFGSADIDSTVSKIRYMVKALGVKYIFLDHLTALATEMADERRGLDEAMARFGKLVQELNFTLFFVSHLAKPPNDQISYEQGRVVTASAFRGSQSIQYWSTFMLGLERNKLSEDPNERMVTTVRVLKDRLTGEADGFTIKLNYDRAKGKMIEQRDVL